MIIFRVVRHNICRAFFYEYAVFTFVQRQACPFKQRPVTDDDAMLRIVASLRFFKLHARCFFYLGKQEVVCLMDRLACLYAVAFAKSVLLADNNRIIGEAVFNEVGKSRRFGCFAAEDKRLHPFGKVSDILTRLRCAVVSRQERVLTVVRRNARHVCKRPFRRVHIAKRLNIASRIRNQIHARHRARIFFCGILSVAQRRNCANAVIQRVRLPYLRRACVNKAVFKRKGCVAVRSSEKYTDTISAYPVIITTSAVRAKNVHLHVNVFNQARTARRNKAAAAALSCVGKRYVTDNAAVADHGNKRSAIIFRIQPKLINGVSATVKRTDKAVAQRPAPTERISRNGIRCVRTRIDKSYVTRSAVVDIVAELEIAAPLITVAFAKLRNITEVGDIVLRFQRLGNKKHGYVEGVRFAKSVLEAYRDGLIAVSIAKACRIDGKHTRFTVVFAAEVNLVKGCRRKRTQVFTDSEVKGFVCRSCACLVRRQNEVEVKLRCHLAVCVLIGSDAVYHLPKARIQAVDNRLQVAVLIIFLRCRSRVLIPAEGFIAERPPHNVSVAVGNTDCIHPFVGCVYRSTQGINLIQIIKPAQAVFGRIVFRVELCALRHIYHYVSNRTRSVFVCAVKGCRGFTRPAFVKFNKATRRTNPSAVRIIMHVYVFNQTVVLRGDNRRHTAVDNVGEGYVTNNAPFCNLRDKTVHIPTTLVMTTPTVNGISAAVKNALKPRYFI